MRGAAAALGAGDPAGGGAALEAARGAETGAAGAERGVVLAAGRAAADGWPPRVNSA
jgi:hypothetical protein